MNAQTKFTKGQQVKCGSSTGTVLRYRGPFAVEVWTYFERPDQDFLTHKVTVSRGYRSETWPIKSVIAA